MADEDFPTEPPEFVDIEVVPSTSANVFPPRNLGPDADAWGRDVERRLAAAESGAVAARDSAYNVGLAQTGLGEAIGIHSEILATQAEQIAVAVDAAVKVEEQLAPIEPPITPSVPTVTSKLSVVRVAWDGTFPLPDEETDDGPVAAWHGPDYPGLRAVYAEMTTTEPPLVEPEPPAEEEEPLPPHPWTRVGQGLTDKGTIIVPATVGDVLWFRLVAVNRADLVSVGTTPVQVTVVGVDVPDFEDAVIDLIGEGGGGTGSLTIDATTDPEVDGTTVGDTWRKFSSLDETGQLQGIWRWNGTGWVQTALVVDGSILARHINVEDVWADEAFIEQAEVNVLKAGVITGEMIDGTAINGKTITGATVQTSSEPDSGVKMVGNGLVAYDGAGNEVVHLGDGDVPLFTGGFFTRADQPRAEFKDYTSGPEMKFIGALDSDPVGYLRYNHSAKQLDLGIDADRFTAGGGPRIRAWRPAGSGAYIELAYLTPGEIQPSGVRVSDNKVEQFRDQMSSEIQPAGIIQIYPVATPPAGWLLCDGQAVSRTTYARLFALIGTSYGAGNGSTTFNVPNLKGRVVVGQDSAQTEFDTISETGGAKTHTLTEAQIPSHDHAVDPPATTSSSSSVDAQSSTVLATSNPGSTQYMTRGTSSSGVIATNPISASSHEHSVNIPSFTSGAAGGGGAHNNLQPYLVLNYIIKA